MNGGYIMIYKDSRRIYLELFVCLTLGKPILWYEDKNTCFFIDTISGGEISTEIVDDEEVRTYGDIILTKGGMTITITAENVVTEVGDIQPSEGSEVIANPTLSGDEGDLTGLEVDGVKYAIPSGGSGGSELYEHNIVINYANNAHLNVKLYTISSSPFTKATLSTFLQNNSVEISASGGLLDTNSNLCIATALLYYNGNLTCIAYPVGSSSYSVKYLDISGNAYRFTDTVVQIS